MMALTVKGKTFSSKKSKTSPKENFMDNHFGGFLFMYLKVLTAAAHHIIQCYFILVRLRILSAFKRVNQTEPAVFKLGIIFKRSLFRLFRIPTAVKLCGGPKTSSCTLI